MSSTSAGESGREFLDSNILVYSVDSSAGEKASRAARLLESLWNRRGGCVSVQVLQEFFVIVTTKLPKPLSVADAAARVADFTEWSLHSPGKADLLAAIDMQQRLRVSFWDAMILQSARRMECRVLSTEDLNNGQSYAGVTVRDPFVDLLME